MSYLVNDAAITTEDYVLEFARKLPEGEPFDAETCVLEDVTPEKTMLAEYERAIRVLLAAGKIRRA